MVSAPIVDEIRRLKTQLKEIRTSNETAQDLKEYKDLEELLLKTKSVYVAYFAEYLALLDFVDVTGSKDFKDLFDELSQKFEDIIAAVDKKRLTTGGIFALNPPINRFKSLIDQAWSAYIRRQIDGVFNALKVFKDFVSDFNMVSDAKIKIESARPTTPTIGDKINKLVTACNTRIAQVGSDPEIRTFIEKVSKGEATLDDLTPKILEWLKDKKYSKKIKIQM